MVAAARSGLAEPSEPLPVLFLTYYDRIGAPSRYRYYQFFSRLQEADLEPTTHFIQSERMYQMKERRQSKALFALLVAGAYLKRMALLLFRGGRFPVWVVEKELFPFVPYWIERFFYRRGVRVIVDYDDAVFLKYDRGSGLTSLLNKNKIGKVMRRADVVFSGNEFISEYASNAGASDIRWMPSVVDETKYQITDRSPVSAGTPVVIGWMGSYRNSRHVTSIAPALQRLARTENFILRIVGGGRIAMPPEINVEYRDWSEGHEVEEIRQFAIGIMPLENGDWEKGKCGLKLIQYLAAGVPVIATPIGVNARIVVPGLNGYHATTNDEWFAALQHLLAEIRQGRFLPAQCADTVRDTFTVSAQAPAMVAAIKMLAAR